MRIAATFAALLLSASAAAPAHASGTGAAFRYTGEYARSISDGQPGDAYADQYFVSATAGSERLGWANGSFTVEVTHRSGKALEEVLDLPLLQQVQSVYGAGNVTRLTQLSYRHRFDAVPLAVTVGRIYPNADFFAFSCHYQHMTFCGGPPGNVTNGWFADPVSQYGAVLALEIGGSTQAKLGAYDINPHNLSSAQGLRLDTSGRSTGTLVVGELEGTLARTRWRLGAWHDSSEYTGVEAMLGKAAALREHETGAYMGIEHDLVQLDAGRALRGFVNVVRADADTNQVDRLEAVGVWLDGPLADRPDDRIALAVGRTRVNRRLYNDATPVHVEYPVELNYRAVLAPWLAVMPNLQRIRQRGPRATATTLLGVRVEFAF